MVNGNRNLNTTVVIVDTNAIIYAVKKRIDLKRSIPLELGNAVIYVPESVRRELRKLSRNSPDAKSALSYAALFETVETTADGDDGVIEAATGRRSAILTNDRELISRSRAAGIGILTVREGRKLELLHAPL